MVSLDAAVVDVVVADAALKLVVATATAAAAFADVCCFFFDALLLGDEDALRLLLFLAGCPDAGADVTLDAAELPYRSRSPDMFIIELMKRCLLPTLGGSDGVGDDFGDNFGDDFAWTVTASLGSCRMAFISCSCCCCCCLAASFESYDSRNRLRFSLDK